MIRRRVLGGVCSLGVPWHRAHATGSDAIGSDSTIVLGQSANFSGGLGDIVKEFNAGAQLHFDELNAHGGIHGRRLQLTTLDDGLVPAKAVANCRTLLGEHRAFAFFGCVGSATVAASAQVFRESNAPLLGHLAVGDAARQAARGAAYFVRATYAREADKMVEHLGTIGITQIAVATLDNPTGADLLASVRSAVSARGGSGAAIVSAAIKSDASNVVAVGRALAEAQPQAVIVFLSGPPVAELMKTMWQQGSSPSFYGISVMAGELVARLLGAQFRGLVVAQVMPYPWAPVEPTAMVFRKLCERHKVRVGYASFEGYVNALVAAEGLRRAGRDARRSTLHAAMQAMKLRLAGINFDFTQGEPTGSRFVELVRVASDGRFVR